MVDRSTLDAPGLLTQCYADARQIAAKHDVTQTTVPSAPAGPPPSEGWHAQRS